MSPLRLSMYTVGLCLLAGCTNASKGYGDFNECANLGWCEKEAKKKPPSFACEVLGQCSEDEVGGGEGEGGGGGASGSTATSVGGGDTGDHDSGGHGDSGAMH